ncbi:WD40 repeat domain-containing protein [Candidatus Poribacteria bacterium]|nr:WD40 repeat domain-containing protein [Candidatus Poribacteria bacterium]
MKTKYLSFTTILLTAVLISISFGQDNTQVGLPEGAIARLGKGRVVVMRFSSDGKRLAVGTTIGVWLYDVGTGNAKALYPAHPRHVDNKMFKPSEPEEWQPYAISYVNHLAFSPDNRILATGESNNGVVQLWDLESGTELSTLPFTIAGDAALAITFSDDGKTLITPNKFGEIIHWDVATRSIKNYVDSYRPKLTMLEEDGKYGNHSYDEIAFAQDRKTFVSGDPRDGKMRLWDAATGQQLAIFKAKSKFAGISRQEPEPQKGVNALAFSSDGKTVASGHDDNTVRLWDITTRTEIATLKGHNQRINKLVFSPDGTVLASGSADKTILLWDVLQKKQKQVTFSGHRAGVSEVTFSHDGKTVASGSTDGTIRFWNANTGREMSIFATGHTGWIGDVAFSADNTMLATAASNGTVQIWNVETGQQLPSPSVAHHDTTEALAFSRDATLFASNGSDTTVRSRSGNTRTSWMPHKETRLWTLLAGEELHSFPQSSKALAFSPDNNILAASGTKETRLWDVKTATELSRLNARQFFTDVVVTFSRDGTILATGGINGETHLWDVNTGQKIVTLKAAIREYTKTIAFSPDNIILAVGYVNNHIRLWDLKTHKEINTPLTAQKKIWIKKLTFSPDGKTLLLITTDFKIPREIQLWDVKTGQQFPSIRTGHTLGIQTLVFSNDGKILASGDADGTVLLWDWDKIISKAKENKGN